MGMFDFLKGKGNTRETTRNVDGYEIGVESGMIYHCPRGLTEYVLPIGAKGLTNEACMEMSQTIERLDVPASFVKFDKYPPLNNAKKLKDVHFAEGIQDIDVSVFSANASFNVPKSVSHLSAGLYTPSDDGRLVFGQQVTSIATNFASHDYRIQQVEIPGSIDKVSDGAFNQCKNINTVIFHRGVTEAGRGAFRGTNKLKLVELPDGFNGSFDAPMESRGGRFKQAGKEYYYDSKDFEKDADSKLTIKIERGDKNFTFEIRRGDFETLSLDGNNITIGDLECDMSKLNPSAVYTIFDGKLTSNMTREQEQEEHTRKVREAINGGTPHSSTPSKTNSTVGKQKFLEEQDFSKYNPNTINKMIINMKKKCGIYYDGQPLEDLSDFINVKDKLTSVDIIMLTIALNAKMSLLNEGNFKKKLAENMKELYNNRVITSFSFVKKFDKEKGGALRKIFDSQIKDLEKIER